MKTLITILLLNFCAVPFSNAQDQVGRYQLQVAIDLENQFNHHTLYKIDTVTGQVWMYTRVLDRETGKWIAKVKLIDGDKKDDDK